MLGRSCASSSAFPPRARRPGLVRLAAVLSAALLLGGVPGAQEPAAGPGADQDQAEARFQSGVDFVNIAVTVTDQRGRFVPDLDRDDFTVYDDGQPQTIAHFSRERIPTSLGLVLDTSGSMSRDKMAAARRAVARLLDDFLQPGDEVFLSRFATTVELVQPWTAGQDAVTDAVDHLRTGGGTALYDAIRDAVTIAQTGRHPRKAIVVISDGNDTASAATIPELRAHIRQSDVLVYAIGVDSEAPALAPPPRRQPGTFPIPRPIPMPLPGRGRPPVIIGGRGGPVGGGDPGGGGQRGPWTGAGTEHRVNAAVLRGIAEDTGGRTEIIRDFGDLAGATARIAEELGRQYLLGYVRPAARDGRWHTIRVETGDRQHQVRARRGYVAS
ncbi:MAG: VWA domain-containing protein [Acidimicrobiia bacterium]|nr:VWA domain-containing protein [Acidimicrobiia bacterium]